MEKTISNDKGQDKNKINNFDIYICLIGFNEANNNLVKKILKEKKNKIYENY